MYFLIRKTDQHSMDVYKLFMLDNTIINKHYALQQWPHGRVKVC